MSVRAISLAAFLLVSVLAPGCRERVCTLIGCANGFEIHLTRSAPLAAGSYGFQFVIDGRAVSCSLTLPTTSQVQACAEGSGVTVAAGPGAALGDVHIDGTPESVLATVTHGAETIASGSFKPLYRESRPNGPECPPVCKNAEASLRFVGG